MTRELILRLSADLENGKAVSPRLAKCFVPRLRLFAATANSKMKTIGFPSKKQIDGDVWRRNQLINLYIEENRDKIDTLDDPIMEAAKVFGVSETTITDTILKSPYKKLNQHASPEFRNALLQDLSEILELGSYDKWLESKF